MKTGIILLGPPGAGKGTQAKALSQGLSLIHISTGDLLRQNVAQGTQFGIKAKDFMNKGVLVPDELVNAMLIQRMRQADIKKGFILDGYPRNLAQAQALDIAFKELNLGIDLVLYLETSEPVVIQRLTGRLVCKSCGANFHTTNMPPKKASVCDNCGGVLYQRTDDKEETIRKRLEVYLKETSALIKYYQEKKILHTLCADDDAGVVLNKMIQLIKS